MGRTQIVALAYGWLSIGIGIIFFSMIMALTIKLTSISNFTLTYLTFAFGIISLFIGGLIAGLKGKGNGWLIGICTGLGFTLFTFFIQYLGYSESFSFQQMIYHATYIFATIF